MSLHTLLYLARDVTVYVAALGVALVTDGCAGGHSTDLHYQRTGSNPYTCAVVRSGEQYEDLDVVIPAEVTIDGCTYAVNAIADSAFADQHRLRSVSIPSTVVTIAANAFVASPAICNYLVDADNPKYSSSTQGCLMQDGGAVLVNYPAGRPEQSFDLPEGVAEVREHAFCYAASLRQVSLPASLKDIGQHAFYHSGVENILIDDSNPYLIDIDGAVVSADGKRFIQFPLGRSGDYQVPDGVVRVDDRSFAHAAHVGRITIPRSVEQIGSFAFYCSLVRGIDVEDHNEHYCSTDGLLLSKDGTRLLTVPPGHQGLLSVPQGVTDICQCAATNCPELQAVALPKGLLRIGPGAFAYCHALHRLSMPNSLRSIESGAFAGCLELDTVEIATGVLPPTGLDNEPLERAALANGVAIQPCAPGYAGQYHISN